MLQRRFKTLAKSVLPERVQRSLRARRRNVWPPVGLVRFGSLRRLNPISVHYGNDRGTPVDRYYIEDFLRRHAGAKGYAEGDIRGRVLEVGDDFYSREIGGWAGTASDHGPQTVDILHVDDSNESATIVADLADAPHIPSETFDCIICVQTLLLIYDTPAAIATLHRILKPGGVVLATVPGISKVCRPEADLWGDYWRFTSLSARRLFQEVFAPENVKVDSYGNVLSAIAFLHGIAAEELKREELELRDPNYEVLIAVRAVKGGP